jgi:hypothetical protein
MHLHPAEWTQIGGSLHPMRGMVGSHSQRYLCLLPD